MVHGTEHVCDQCGDTLTNDEVDYWSRISGYQTPDDACWVCEECSREEEKQ
jgi:hypothetical protein